MLLFDTTILGRQKLKHVLAMSLLTLFRIANKSSDAGASSSPLGRKVEEIPRYFHKPTILHDPYVMPSGIIASGSDLITAET